MTSRCASDIMRADEIAQGGAIINTGSMAAVAANPEQCSYVATKHALLGFSMSAFEVLRHHGVKVAIINPGAQPWTARRLLLVCWHACSSLVGLRACNAANLYRLSPARSN
jgi:NAD(P)-dependent dehydrogenase (short-subunit alcohol dehydrogenase family)